MLEKHNYNKNEQPNVNFFKLFLRILLRGGGMGRGGGVYFPVLIFQMLLVLGTGQYYLLLLV